MNYTTCSKTKNKGEMWRNKYMEIEAQTCQGSGFYVASVGPIPTGTSIIKFKQWVAMG